MEEVFHKVLALSEAQAQPHGHAEEINDDEESDVFEEEDNTFSSDGSKGEVDLLNGNVQSEGSSSSSIS